MSQSLSRFWRIFPTLLVASTLLFTVVLATEAEAKVPDKCYAKTFAKLGPKTLANANGKVRAQWCVSSKGKIKNVRLSGTAEPTNLGSIQGYSVVSKLGPAKNKHGDRVPKNPNSKSVSFYFGYKIRACPAGWIVCGPNSAYLWKLSLGNKGGSKQVYVGKY